MRSKQMRSCSSINSNQPPARMVLECEAVKLNRKPNTHCVHDSRCVNAAPPPRRCGAILTPVRNPHLAEPYRPYAYARTVDPLRAPHRMLLRPRIIARSPRPRPRSPRPRRRSAAARRPAAAARSPPRALRRGVAEKAAVVCVWLWYLESMNIFFHSVSLLLIA